MKKRLLLCVLILLISVSGAFCAGKLSVVQENFHVISSWGTYAYSYAKVKNIGDKPIKVNAGLLEVFDENDDALTSSEYIEAFASYLLPGEYTYVRSTASVDDPYHIVGDYSLTLTGKSTTTPKIVRLQCETELQLGVESGWWTYDYMTATVTNNTDVPQYDIQVVLALLDADDNILYIDSDELYSNRALTPGSSMIIRSEISSSFMDYFRANGIVPAKVDAIAFVLADDYF